MAPAAEPITTSARGVERAGGTRRAGSDGRWGGLEHLLHDAGDGEVNGSAASRAWKHVGVLAVPDSRGPSA